MKFPINDLHHTWTVSHILLRILRLSSVSMLSSHTELSGVGSLAEVVTPWWVISHAGEEDSARLRVLKVHGCGGKIEEVMVFDIVSCCFMPFQTSTSCSGMIENACKWLMDSVIWCCEWFPLAKLLGSRESNLEIKMILYDCVWYWLWEPHGGRLCWVLRRILILSSSPEGCCVFVPAVRRMYLPCSQESFAGYDNLPATRNGEYDHMILWYLAQH